MTASDSRADPGWPQHRGRGRDRRGRSWLLPPRAAARRRPAAAHRLCGPPHHRADGACSGRRAAGRSRALGRAGLSHRALPAAARHRVQPRGGVPHLDLCREGRRRGPSGRSRCAPMRTRIRPWGPCWSFMDLERRWAISDRDPDPALAQRPRRAARRCRASDPAVARAGRLHGDRGRRLPGGADRRRARRLRSSIPALRSRAGGADRTRAARFARYLGILPCRRHRPGRADADRGRLERSAHVRLPGLALRRISGEPNHEPDRTFDSRRATKSRFYWASSESESCAGPQRA